MELVMLLLPYAAPIVLGVYAAWIKWKEGTAKGAVGVLTTAIEIVNTKEVKEVVAILSKGTKMEGVIEESLSKLDKAAIRKYIEEHKK